MAFSRIRVYVAHAYCRLQRGFVHRCFASGRHNIFPTTLECYSKCQYSWNQSSGSTLSSIHTLKQAMLEPTRYLSCLSNSSCLEWCVIGTAWHQIWEIIKKRQCFLYLNNRVLLSRAPSCDRLPEEIWCSRQILLENVVRGLIWSLNITFPRESITNRAWDRRTLLFLYYNAKFWAKISKSGHYAEERHYRVTWSISINGRSPISRCTINLVRSSSSETQDIEDITRRCKDMNFIFEW